MQRSISEKVQPSMDFIIHGSCTLKRMKHPRFKHIVIGNPVAIYHTELRQVLLMTIVYQMQRP